MTTSMIHDAASGEDGPPSPDIDADLLWMAAQHRRLARARSGMALAARLRSCAQVSVEIDEFFRTHVSAHPQLTGDDPDQGLEQAAPSSAGELRAALEAIATAQDELFVQDLGPQLEAAGIHLVGWYELDDTDQRRLTELFEQRIYPVLTPLAVDPGHPFPYVSDLSLNLAVLVEDPVDGRRHFARVKVPGAFHRLVALPEGRFVPLEQVIVAHLGWLFPGLSVCGHHAFRVTRDGAPSGRSRHSSSVDGRRSGRTVRLEHHQSMTKEISQLLCRELDLGNMAVYQRLAPLDLTCLLPLADLLDRRSAPAPRHTPRVVAVLAVLIVVLVVAAALVLALR
ncbi:MAG: hypothetical protein ACR2QE_16660 [Acidimicrobiales bacterium]